MTGAPSLGENIGRTPADRERAFDQLRQALAEGKPVYSGMDWNPLHWVLVTGVTEVDGRTFVTLDNPVGQEERVSKEQFLESLRLMTWQ